MTLGVRTGFLVTGVEVRKFWDVFCAATIQEPKYSTGIPVPRSSSTYSSHETGELEHSVFKWPENFDIFVDIPNEKFGSEAQKLITHFVTIDAERGNAVVIYPCPFASYGKKLRNEKF